MGKDEELGKKKRGPSLSAECRGKTQKKRVVVAGLSA